MPVARVEIADFGTRRTLIVERFDRLWTRDERLLRLPQEDFCQALSLSPKRKHESEGGPGLRAIVGLLRGSDTPDDDIATFLRAIIAFWLIGATDGHAKNFSVFLTPGGGFQLTPLYDVLTAQPSFDARRITRRQFRLAMAVGEKRHYAVGDIAPRHFLQTAATAGVGKSLMRGLFEDLAANAKSRMAAVVASLPHAFPPELVDSVAAALTRRARLLVETV